MNDIHRPRGDMYEVAVWEDILKVQGKELFFVSAVDNQAIVIPENIDAVRALSGRSTGEQSTSMTDEALGVRADFL